MALTLKVPYSAEEEAKMAVAALRTRGDLLSGRSDSDDDEDMRSHRARALGRSASMGSVSMSSAVGLGSGISDAIGGAKAKLDELFVHWLSQPDTGELFQELLTTIKAGKPLTVPAHTSLVSSLLHRSGGAPGSAGSGGGSPLRSKNSPPPRSPSRAAAVSNVGSGGGSGSPNSLHFTFSNQSLLSTDGSSDGGARGSPTNVRRGVVVPPTPRRTWGTWGTPPSDLARVPATRHPQQQQPHLTSVTVVPLCCCVCAPASPTAGSCCRRHTRQRQRDAVPRCRRPPPTPRWRTPHRRAT